MSNETVFLVEDENDIAQLLKFHLEREHFKVYHVLSGEEALKRIADVLPDIILLDWMLPKMDGLSVCRALRADPRTAAIPLIMTTAKDADSDVVLGLEFGADDYLAKPFSPAVLIARIRALLRRKGTQSAEEVLTCGELMLSVLRREVQINGTPVELTFSEFELLHLLLKHPGRVYSRTQIVNHTKGGEYAVTERAVDVQIVGLRKKLGAYGERIQTIRGVGYRFSA